jgi:hypothetical protein
MQAILSPFLSLKMQRKEEKENFIGSKHQSTRLDRSFLGRGNPWHFRKVGSDRPNRGAHHKLLLIASFSFSSSFLFENKIQIKYERIINMSTPFLKKKQSDEDFLITSVMSTNCE